MHIPDEPPIGNLVAYEYLWLSQESMREDGAKVIRWQHIAPARPLNWRNTLRYSALRAARDFCIRARSAG